MNELKNMKEFINRNVIKNTISSAEHIILSFDLKMDIKPKKFTVELENSLVNVTKLLMNKFHFRFAYVSGYNISVLYEAAYEKEHIYNGNIVALSSNFAAYLTMLMSLEKFLIGSYVTTKIFSSPYESFLLKYFVYRGKLIKRNSKASFINSSLGENSLNTMTHFEIEIALEKKRKYFKSIESIIKYGTCIKKIERINTSEFKFKVQHKTIEDTPSDLNFILDDFLVAYEKEDI